MIGFPLLTMLDMQQALGCSERSIRNNAELMRLSVKLEGIGRVWVPEDLKEFARSERERGAGRARIVSYGDYEEDFREEVAQ